MMLKPVLAIDESPGVPVFMRTPRAPRKRFRVDAARWAKYRARRISSALLDAAVEGANVCKDSDARYLYMRGVQLALAAAILEGTHEPQSATADLRSRARELREYLIGTNAEEALADLFGTVDSMVREIGTDDRDAWFAAQVVQAEFVAEYPREGRRIKAVDICAAMRAAAATKRGQKKWQSGAHQDIATKLGIASEFLRDEADCIRSAMARPFGSSPLLSRVLCQLRRIPPSKRGGK
jgi:hypothetical protein